MSNNPHWASDNCPHLMSFYHQTLTPGGSKYEINYQAKWHSTHWLIPLGYRHIQQLGIYIKYIDW